MSKYDLTESATVQVEWSKDQTATRVTGLDQLPVKLQKRILEDLALRILRVRILIEPEPERGRND